MSARRNETGLQPWETVLSVPLASRQREIEREIDELNRGVLVGAVVVVLFAAGLGASVAARVSDPVARLTRATRLIAAGRLDERLVADTADELGRLVEDFNSMTETLVAQRAELARTNQLKAWAEMARQVAHEIKNPLTPIQLAAEHLQKRPRGPAPSARPRLRSVPDHDPETGPAAAADRVGVLELCRPDQTKVCRDAAQSTGR